MSFNLAELQQKVDRLLTMCSTIVNTYWDMFYDPDPGSVEVPVYDEEGNLTTITLPNRSKVIADGEAALNATMINTNTTVYVSPSGSDTTGDGTMAAPLATVQAAVDKVRKLVFLPGVSVTIQLDDGAFPVGQNIHIDHPFGSQITVEGKNTYETTTLAVTVSGTSAVVTVGDAGNIAPGDMVIIRSPSGGTHPEALSGAYQVIGLSGNQITLRWPVAPDVAPDGAVVGTVTVLKTVLYTSGAPGKIFTVYSAVNISNLGIRQDTAEDTTAFSFNGYRVSLKCVGVSGVKTGIMCGSNSTTYISQSGISDVSGNAVHCADASYISLAQSAITRAASNGAFVRGSGMLSCSDVMVVEAVTGLNSVANSTIHLKGSTLVAHHTTGCIATDQSLIDIDSTVEIRDNTTDLSPASNTEGNNNSIITDRRS